VSPQAEGRPIDGLVDAHQHFWQLARGDYGWLTPALAPIYRDYGPADLAPFLAEAGIGQTVLVQAAPTEAETDYLLDLAARTPPVAGVVGWVDLEAPDAAQRVRRAARRPKLVGLRPMLHDLADDRWVLRPELEPALTALADTGLVFDALVRPHHLPALSELTARHPSLRVVIDHAAKPDIARWRAGDAAFRAWAGALETLAGRGLACKLSGLVTEARPDWQVDDLRPYVDAVLAAFGPERVLWGSDWPVVDRAGGYRRWRQATEALLGARPAATRRAVLGDSARRAYRLAGA
jgi:L-fuconolactonase